jgi:hypothetical protein
MQIFWQHSHNSKLNLRRCAALRQLLGTATVAG